MLQQLIALVFVAFFVYWIVKQRRSGLMGKGEFALWLAIWLLVGVSVVFIRAIDALVASLGFSGSGIDVLVYLGVALLLYAVVRLRLRIAALDRTITKLVREVALRDNGRKS